MSSRRCPSCGATKGFIVQALATFQWDGVVPAVKGKHLSPALCAVVRDTPVQCGKGDGCMWEGKVSELEPKTVKRKVLFSFSTSMNYDIEVELDLPADCRTSAAVQELVNIGEIDWLEEINQQHSSCSIERQGKLEHRELLATELQNTLGVSHYLRSETSVGAKEIATNFDNDGMSFTDSDGNGLIETLDHFCTRIDHIVPQKAIPVRRWTFFDGTAIVVRGSRWHLGYIDCFCWRDHIQSPGCHNTHE